MPIRESCVREAHPSYIFVTGNYGPISLERDVGVIAERRSHQSISDSFPMRVSDLACFAHGHAGRVDDFRQLDAEQAHVIVEASTAPGLHGLPQRGKKL